QTLFDGGPGDDVLVGDEGYDLVRGFGGEDTLMSGDGVDTLQGGSGADIFEIRLENGEIGAAPDIVEDFLYVGGDSIGLFDVLQGLTWNSLEEVVQATPGPGGTTISIDRGAGFAPALFLEGVFFETADLLSFGFNAPQQPSAGFVDNPYGFSNDSFTSMDPAITPDGLFVAFSDRQNLDDLPGDIQPADEDLVTASQATLDVFVRNMATGAIQRVSEGPNGAQLKTQGGFDAFATNPAISDDGRFVAFATNGVGAAEDGNDSGDVYVRDLFLDTDPVLVSVGADGVTAAGGVPLASPFPFVSPSGAVAISGDGRKVAFVTDAAISSDDTNGERDVYLRDLDTGETELVSALYDQGRDLDRGGAGGGVSVSGDGVAMSADGRYIAYATDASHVSARLFFPNFSQSVDFDGGVDIYLRDTLLDRTMLVSGTDANDVYGLDISADGSRIVFGTAGALDPDDGNNPSNGFLTGFDVYMAEIDLAAFGARDITNVSYQTFVDVRRLSESEAGGDLVGSSFAPKISPDGERVGFVIEDPDLRELAGDALAQDYIEVDADTGDILVTPDGFDAYFGLGGGVPSLYLSGHDLANETTALRVKPQLSADTIAVTTTEAPSTAFEFEAVFVSLF
ncbi:MAG: hypothetical protein AAF360_14100, partial [Pseudomonadota bacterium]